MKIINKFLTVFVLLLSLAVYSQVASGGEPYLNKLLVNKNSANERAVFENFYIQNSEGQTLDLLSLSSIIEKKSLKDIDNDKLIQEATQKQKEQNNGVNIYGKILNLENNISDVNKRFKINDRYFNILEVSSPDAKSLQVYFKDYKLPDGATLFVYDAEGLMVLGSFTSSNNPREVVEGGYSFMTQPLVGNKIILELSYPVDSPIIPVLNLQSVVHGFKSFYSGTYGDGGDCQTNVACNFNGVNDRSKNIKSVGLVLGNYKSNGAYAYTCSGALVNNGKQDGLPYFLTASHCIDKQNYNWKNELLVLFNYEAKTCESNGADAPSNPSNNSVLGCDLLVDSPPTWRDFALLKLNTTKDILAQYKVCYAGWDNSTSAYVSEAFDRYGVHHPKGDAKKIAKARKIIPSTIDYQASPVGDYLSTYWKDGIVLEGSSGSPLFNSFDRLIGSLSTGPSPDRNFDCNNVFIYSDLFSTNYSRFSSNYNQMAQWLDPENKFIQSIGPYCPSGGINIGINPGSFPPYNPPLSNYFEDASTDVNFALVHPSQTFGKKIYSEPYITSQNYNLLVPKPNALFISKSNLIAVHNHLSQPTNTLPFEAKMKGFYRVESCNVLKSIDDNIVLKMKNPVNNQDDPSYKGFNSRVVALDDDRVIIFFRDNNSSGLTRAEIQTYKLVNNKLIYESWLNLYEASSPYGSEPIILYLNNHLIIHHKTTKTLESYYLNNGNWSTKSTITFPKMVDIHLGGDKFFVLEERLYPYEYHNSDNKISVYQFQNNSSTFYLKNTYNNIFNNDPIPNFVSTYKVLNVSKNENRNDSYYINYTKTTRADPRNYILEIDFSNGNIDHLNLTDDFYINSIYYKTQILDDKIIQFKDYGTFLNGNRYANISGNVNIFKKNISTGEWYKDKSTRIYGDFAHTAINENFILQKSTSFGNRDVFNLRELDHLFHPITYVDGDATITAAYNNVKKLTYSQFQKGMGGDGKMIYSNDFNNNNIFYYRHNFFSGLPYSSSTIDNKTLILSDYTEKIEGSKNVYAYASYSIVMKPGFSISSETGVEFHAIPQKDYSNANIPTCSFTFDDMLNPQLGEYTDTLYQKNTDVSGPSYGEIVYLPQDKLVETSVEKAYKIYPNPTSGIIEIEITDIAPNSKISIVSLDGKIIHDKNISNKKTKVDLSSYPLGIYFLNVYANNKLLFSEKVIKK